MKGSAAPVRPSKGLGQHFLRDAGYVAAILDALPAEPERVVEIGPGTGVMTEGLLDKRREVFAVELDDRLLAPLTRRFGSARVFHLVHGDAVQVDLGALAAPPYAMFGNIPYYVTGALIPRMLTSQPGPAWVGVLVQEEVAQRLCAAPGGWSLATLGVRAYADAEILVRVPAHAFDPPPRVDSAFVMLRPHAVPGFVDGAFFDFARLAFQERRKMLPNAVANAMGHDVSRARAVVEASGLDPNRRPQTLDLDEWGRLYAAYRAASV